MIIKKLYFRGCSSPVYFVKKHQKKAKKHLLRFQQVLKFFVKYESEHSAEDVCPVLEDCEQTVKNTEVNEAVVNNL